MCGRKVIGTALPPLFCPMSLIWQNNVLCTSVSPGATPGAGTYLALNRVSLFSHPKLWIDCQPWPAAAVHGAICKVPQRSFPTGSQDNEYEMRAMKFCTNPAGLTPGKENIPTLEHLGAGRLPARPLSRRLVRVVCYALASRHSHAHFTLWTQHRRAAGLSRAHSAPPLPHAAPG